MIYGMKDNKTPYQSLQNEQEIVYRMTYLPLGLEILAFSSPYFTENPRLGLGMIFPMFLCHTSQHNHNLVTTAL
jgi:hypothetical protein